MRRHLSSRLTILIKVWAFVLGIIFICFGIGIIIFKRDVFGFAAFLFLIPSFIISKIHSIAFDEYFIYVKKWKREDRYWIKDIKAINEGDFWRLDPFFQLEIIEDNNEIKKIEFAPRSSDAFAFMLSRENRGELLNLKSRIEELKRLQ